MLHILRSLLALAALLAVAPTARAGEMSDWMTYDAATKTAKMQILSGHPPSVNGGWNFNGYAKGDLTITVPAGATVAIDFKNVDQLQHSLVVIGGEGPLPPQGGDPVFPRAFTIKKVEGIPPGGSDTVRFTAGKPGKYRLFCGVAGHGLAGMWDWFVVSAEATAPSVTATTSAGAPAGGAVQHAAGHAPRTK